MASTGAVAGLPGAAPWGGTQDVATIERTRGLPSLRANGSGPWPARWLREAIALHLPARVAEIASSRCALLAMTHLPFNDTICRHCERSEAISLHSWRRLLRRAARS